MGLDFSASDTHQVDIGNGASINNLTAGGILAWINPATITASGVRGRIIQKGLFGPGNFRNFMIGHTSNGDFTMEIMRATTNLNALSATGQLSASVWQCVATRFDTAGANGDQQLYVGDVNTALTEVSSYSTQLVGSGATGDDSGVNAYISNNSNNNRSINGSISFVSIWNTYPSLGDLQRQQFNTSRMASPSMALFMHLGVHGSGGVGTQIDWSGNGNNGTITGATKTDHAPIQIFPRPGIWRGWDAAAAAARRIFITHT